ncbi:MAG TPA: hypothetical protein DDW52_09385 [Planctomycetaceae bacterium]|nr:hypothetical protein [Planctomycetaceae bacterium]
MSKIKNAWCALFGAALCCLASSTLAEDEVQLRARGELLYAQQCADCHGAAGQGVESAYESPLVGDDSIGQLSQIIAETMPEGEPELCEGTDANAVAAYIHHAFYSEAARVRNRPPRFTLDRLTAEQLRQSLADLYRSFNPRPLELSGQHGLAAEYYDGDRKRTKKIERIDPQLDFDFGKESPGEGIKAEAFTIYWQGGLQVPQSGKYEIVVNSTCSFTMDFGARNRELINNHVQSGDKTEFRRTLHLTGGRVYPLRIEFQQRKRKTELPPARISMSWVPPGGVEQTIPIENLVPDRVPDTFSLQTELPADDRSYGFERGVTVSRAWDESTTNAALEFADAAFAELWPVYQRRNRKEANDQRQILKGFLGSLLRTAMRGDWRPDDQTRFVGAQVDAEPDDREAIKRVLLLGLKSPRFLYPELPRNVSESQRAANTLKLVLHDSIPVEDWLQKTIEKGTLTTESQIRNVAQRLVSEYRTRGKSLDMIHQWLNLDHIGQITKDSEKFPGFDQALQHDMQRSLDALVEHIIWDLRDYRQLFVADWSFTTERMHAVLGPAWKPTSVEAKDAISLSRTDTDPRRRGVLTHPLLLSGLAYFDASSPIHRGVFLIRHVLGRTLRPPNDAFTPLSPDLHPDLTTRERVALQTSPDACQVCHSKINALGFSLEHFDAIGRFREQELERPINASAAYTTLSGDTVQFTDHADLAEFLAASDDAHQAFVRRAFQYFVKQPPAAFGAETLDDLVIRFKQNGFDVPMLIEDIAVVAATRSRDQKIAAELPIGTSTAAK